ncbi:dihydroneopterin aldolase [Hyalangium rubrum]|uniref:dihydroneopterin aldolase n=1 Tax=Hyalangium rubrum TaxID=3103134 RepID=A0ABU5H5S2_9BACT|nr:dihydroneopterin aldolase [Hyalangium sp. s54d21]MDY7228833.1 dihydroneopterin aldolase [Hyalangium sp. s54d21]
MGNTLNLPAVTDARGRPLDIIELQGLTVDCIIGIYHRERVAPQPLRLDVALFLDTREAALGGRLGRTVHYGRLEGELRFLMEACRFELLESAAEALCRYVLAPPTEDSHRASVRAATVRITKPEALSARAIPSLQVHRAAEEMHYAGEDTPFGHVDVIHEGHGYGIYRLRIKPGGTLPAHAHQKLEESELVLGPGLLLQGQPVARGQSFHWPQGAAHQYDNPSPTEQSVLRVDRPRLASSHEVEAREPASLQSRSYYPPE